mmetsp:Transcript_26636/g.67693  ORF Transcript_26636/g.67693 Transcript_26636/m.67693 type:complete len:373 (+) Transcript_26636:1125-2243(+)
MRQQPLQCRRPQGSGGDDPALHAGACRRGHGRARQAAAAALCGGDRERGGPVGIRRRERHCHLLQVLLGGHQVGRVARARVRGGRRHDKVPAVHPWGDPEPGRVAVPSPPEPAAAPHTQGGAGRRGGRANGRPCVPCHVPAARPVRCRRGGGAQHGGRVPGAPRRALPERGAAAAAHPGVIRQRLHARHRRLRPQVHHNGPRAHGGAVLMHHRLSPSPQGHRGHRAARRPHVAQQRDAQQALAHPPCHGLRLADANALRGDGVQEGDGAHRQPRPLPAQGGRRRGAAQACPGLHGHAAGQVPRHARDPRLPAARAGPPERRAGRHQAGRLPAPVQGGGAGAPLRARGARLHLRAPQHRPQQKAQGERVPPGH